MGSQSLIKTHPTNTMIRLVLTLGAVGGVLSSPLCKDQPNTLYPVVPRGFQLSSQDHCSDLCNISPDCLFYVWNTKTNVCEMETKPPIGALEVTGFVTGGRMGETEMSGVLALSSVKVVQAEKENAEMCRVMCVADDDCKRWVWAEEMFGTVKNTCLLDYRDQKGLAKISLNIKTVTVGSCNENDEDHEEEDEVRKFVRKQQPTQKSTAKPKPKPTTRRTTTKPKMAKTTKKNNVTTKIPMKQEDKPQITTKKPSTTKKISTKKPVPRRTTPRRTTARKTTKSKTSPRPTTPAIEETTKLVVTTQRAVPKKIISRKHFATKGPMKKHALSEEVSIVLVPENTNWEEINSEPRIQKLEIEPVDHTSEEPTITVDSSSFTFKEPESF